MLETPVRAVFAAASFEALRMDAVEALRSLPRRGLEIGGVLLGGTHPLTVAALAPVASEHLYGPRYQQSNRDREHFREVFERSNSATGIVSVGLYRTVTLEGEGVEESDAAWLRTYFPRGDAILLLVFPKLTGRITISCFSWDGERLTACASEVAAALPVAEPAAVVIDSPPRARSKKAGWLQEAGFAAVAAVLVFGAVFLSHHQHAAAKMNRPAIAALQPRIGLRAEAVSNGTRLTWDNRSDLFRRGSGALMTVDGREYPITLAELQTGSIFYAVDASPKSFRLTVFHGDGREVQETVPAPAPHAVPPILRRPVRNSARVAPAPPPEKQAPMKLPPPVTSASGSIFPR